MEIPSSLKHKPIITAESYDQIDGPYAGSSDAQGLSLGLAQWNERGSVDMSAKVWRYTGEKWSRQSEELPIHRVLDLALLICESQKHLRDAYRFPKLYDPANPTIGRLELQGGSVPVTVNTRNDMIDQDMKLFRDFFDKESERIAERLSSLAKSLRDLGY